MTIVHGKNVAILIVFFLCLGGTLQNTAVCLQGKPLSSPEIVDMQKSPTTVLDENASYHYVIITSKQFEKSNFQYLMEYKSQYISTILVTIEEIVANRMFWVRGRYGDATSRSGGNPWIDDGKEATANFSRFNDTQAKIRNFIRFARSEWNTEYVLLGGDVETLPVRMLYVNISGWDGGFILNRTIEAEIPSDLYYATLQGTWNDDCDQHFGERKEYSLSDEADFNAEVFVGRAPVDGKNDIAAFVKKVMHFETTEKPKNIVLHQSNLRPSGQPDTSVIPEACARLIPEDYTIKRLYQKYERVTIEKWIDAFKAPPKFLILHVGNGNYYGPTQSWYQLHYSHFGREKFTNFHVGMLYNDFFPIHISISCLAGNFYHTDCLAEELLLWSEGGPSACIFNSEVGCVKSEDALAYSGEFIEREFYELFQNNTGNLGKICQFAKEHFADKVVEDPNYRWCYYEINLLGDPETPVFETRKALPPPMVFVDDDYTDATPGWQTTHFATIQDGIDASLENGIVYVYSGIYHENIVLNKTISLQGEDKYTTIIEGGEMRNTIVVQANSSTVSNFTILSESKEHSEQEYNGVFIPPNCEGNRIEHTIITGHSGCGIYVHGSCRNLIHDNIIQSNGYGVCLTNDTHGLFETSVVVTCNNRIQLNTIKENYQCGVYLYATINNHILENNFFDNGPQEGVMKGIGDAYFKISRGNKWAGNYWSEPRTSPKVILGTTGPLFPHYLDYSNGLIFPEIKYLAIINIGIPLPAIDREPMQEPYDIE
jgi:parallel beta-helix repeat protein